MVMGRVVLIQATGCITRIVKTQEVSDSPAALETSYDVDGRCYPVRSYRRHDAGPFVELAAEPDAIEKGRNYAAALGGSLNRVEHIADVGLLGGESTTLGRQIALSKSAARSVGEPETPSLDPVPQELTAIIEARFIANVAELRPVQRLPVHRAEPCKH
jgi:hypothetical protein